MELEVREVQEGNEVEADIEEDEEEEEEIEEVEEAISIMKILMRFRIETMSSSIDLNNSSLTTNINPSSKR